MKYAPCDIAGLIYKKKIGGRRGYSLCYIIFKDMNVALGIYITPESRGEIDYRKFPWQILASAIKDFKDKEIEKFRIV